MIHKVLVKKNDATVTPNPTEYYNSQNGHWYLKDQNGNNLTGWQKLSGNRTVYYNTTGEMLYGEQNISSRWYFFNTTMVMSLKVGISYQMDAKSIMMLIAMVMVRVCCMGCGRLAMITTTLILDMVQRKAV